MHPLCNGMWKCCAMRGSSATKPDERGADVHRLNGAYAQARDGSLLQQPLEKTEKSNATVNVAPIASQVDPGKNDFLVPSLLQFADLLDDLLGRQAAAAAADGWNHAEGATRVAAVLNLERGTSAVVREYGSKMEFVGNLSHQRPVGWSRRKPLSTGVGPQQSPR